jgi:tetratricopeptide (TPR) repeat protein
VELSPDNYFTPVDIGLRYARSKQWTEAGKWYALSLRINPDGGAAYGNWVEALVEAGEMKEAREKLVQGLLISDGSYINLPPEYVVKRQSFELEKDQYQGSRRVSHRQNRDHDCC